MREDFSQKTKEYPCLPTHTLEYVRGVLQRAKGMLKPRDFLRQNTPPPPEEVPAITPTNNNHQDKRLRIGSSSILEAGDVAVGYHATITESAKSDLGTAQAALEHNKETLDDGILKYLTGQRGGLNRFSVQSKVFLKKMPNICKQLYGFDTFREVRRIIYAGFDLKHEEPTVALLKGQSQPLTAFEECLMALMYIESGMSQAEIAGIFGYISPSTVSSIVNVWVPRWGEVGEDLTILPVFDTGPAVSYNLNE
mmetsp:Transcript_2374/g.5439  ORF Transcript_2374/g.5439 Transcript_2374/m.5439 type:complete len:252 (+) Transcript_2374:131-886(+)